MSRFYIQKKGDYILWCHALLNSLLRAGVLGRLDTEEGAGYVARRIVYLDDTLGGATTGTGRTLGRFGALLLR